MIKCTIVLEYPDERRALSVYNSVKPDNKGYVKGSVDGNRIVFEISDRDAMSLSHTVNDLLACVKAAESSIS